MDGPGFEISNATPVGYLIDPIGVVTPSSVTAMLVMVPAIVTGDPRVQSSATPMESAETVMPANGSPAGSGPTVNSAC
jgi:hypothetical protein